jgi:hypothetical protein
MRILGYDLYLDGITGLNVYPWPRPQPPNVSSPMSISISTIEFYFNNTQNFPCRKDLIPDPTETEGSLFDSLLYDLFLDYTNTYTSTAVCPHLFKNARLLKFELYGQVDSFLYVQLLKFANVSDTESIGSNIIECNIYGYNYKVNQGLVNPLVFKTVNSFDFSNTIASIEPDTFKSFKNLTKIGFNLDSVGNFYHQVGIEWMLTLPSTGMHVEVSPSPIAEPVPYTYPDKDLCLFASFPQNRSIYLEAFTSIDYNGDTYAFNTCTNTLVARAKLL